MCCAWVAESLIQRGYLPEDRNTIELVKRWSKAPVDAWIGGKSAAYLTSSGQAKDLSFILANVGDLTASFMMQNGEVVMDADAPGETRDEGTQYFCGHVDSRRTARLFPA